MTAGSRSLHHARLGVGAQFGLTLTEHDSTTQRVGGLDRGPAGRRHLNFAGRNGITGRRDTGRCADAEGRRLGGQLPDAPDSTNLFVHGDDITAGGADAPAPCACRSPTRGAASDARPSPSPSTIRPCSPPRAPIRPSTPAARQCARRRTHFVNRGACQLIGATISITGGLLAGDHLNFTSQSGHHRQPTTPPPAFYMTLTGGGITGGLSDRAGRRPTFSSTAQPRSHQRRRPDAAPARSPPPGQRQHPDLDRVGRGDHRLSPPPPPSPPRPPTITGSSASSTYHAGGGAVVRRSPRPWPSPITRPSQLHQFKRDRLDHPGGLLAGDTLNFTNRSGITGSYDAASGVLTLSGAASVALPGRARIR